MTLPADLDRVDAALRSTAGTMVRVGIGQDLHPFGAGSPLILGGVTIAGAPRLDGHSDGDVVLHAIADAILGAAGLGDLGRLFPAGPETPRGVASTELLGSVVRKAADAGFLVEASTSRSSPPGRASASSLVAMAARIAGPPRRRGHGGQRQGVHRQPRRVRGRGTRDLGARARHAQRRRPRPADGR